MQNQRKQILKINNLIVLGFVTFLFLGMAKGESASESPELKDTEIKKLTVTSSSFRNGEFIPRKHTCDGRDKSPALRWDPIPKGTQSFVIIADDPDAPNGTWTHWILYDMPPTINFIPKGFPPIKKLANAEKHGLNDFAKLGYAGPCPPLGEEHRYYFRVYAVDKMFGFDASKSREEIDQAIEGHVLAKGELMGRYKR